VQQVLALALFYPCVVGVLADILGLWEIPKVAYITMIGVYGLVLWWMSSNTCPICDTSVFAKSEKKAFDSFATPNRECSKCRNPIPE
jgi:hypothetical protein